MKDKDKDPETIEPSQDLIDFLEGLDEPELEIVLDELENIEDELS